MIYQFARIIVLTGLLFTWFILFTSKFDNQYGIRSFVVLTGSMQPDIPVGSLIITKKALNYSNGDIITYKQGNITLTHRIVGQKTKRGIPEFITKGDANNTSDNSTVRIDEIYGKPIMSIPFFGHIIPFMKMTAGFILTIIIPAMVFIFLEVKTIKIELENEFRKKYQAI